MDFKIAVLAGDGIGPEISVQGVDVMSAVCEKFGHKVSYEMCIRDSPLIQQRIQGLSGVWYFAKKVLYLSLIHI